MMVQKDKYLIFFNFLLQIRAVRGGNKQQVLCQHPHALLLEG